MSEEFLASSSEFTKFFVLTFFSENLVDFLMILLVEIFRRGE